MFGAVFLALGLNLAPPLMPNPTLTPGAVDPAVTQTNIATTICRDGYTESVRNVSAATKLAVMKEYGVSRKSGPLEIDHRVPLEVGGSNAMANLWPETRARVRYSAWDKDPIETEAKRRVCAGELSLHDAQAIFLGDWRPTIDAWHVGAP